MELSSFLTDVELEEDWWTGDEIHDLRENEVESDTLRVRRYNWGGKKNRFLLSNQHLKQYNTLITQQSGTKGTNIIEN